MIRRGLSGIVCLLMLAFGANAKSALVRSGEHATFTRLVIMAPSDTEWQVEQTDTRIILRMSNPPWDFDLRKVFDRIPKTRIEDVQPLPDRSGLQFEIKPDVTSTTFPIGRRGIAIDVSDAREPPPPTNTGQIIPLPSHPPTAQLPAFPDHRVIEAENHLLLQLGRAATQGTVQKTDLKAPRLPLAKDPPLGMASATAMDAGGYEIASIRSSCLPDTDFDVAAWIDERPFASQLAQARVSLLTDLDRPDPATIAQLAKLYIGFGWAPEARQILLAFGQPLDDHATTLLAMAEILDNRRSDAPAPFAGMSGCNGTVALWAVMASPKPDYDSDINIPALLRGYSALPTALREILQQRLIDRLLAIDARDAATAVKNALAREDILESAITDLSTARIALSAGKADTAARTSEPAIAGSDMTAAQALALRIKAVTSENQAVPQAETLKAADFARSLGATRPGYRMRQAQATGLGSVGDFASAFAVLEKWPTEAEPDLRRETEATLFDQLVRVPDDALFLATALPRTDQIMHADIGLTQQIAISERLTKLGFGKAGAGVLAPITSQDERGKLALARAALAQEDYGNAIAILEEIEGPAADMLRAQALSGIGEHGAAAALFAAQGDASRAALEAWRSGSHDAIRSFGTDIQKASIAPAAAPSPPGLDVLSRASLAVDRSRKDRETAEKLLAETPP